MRKMTVKERAEIGRLMIDDTLRLITKNYGLKTVDFICGFEASGGDPVNGRQIITNMKVEDIKAWAMAIYETACEGNIIPCKGVRGER